MAREIAASSSYLHRVLSDGERPFHYRGRVRALLGVPEVGSVIMNFARPLPFVGFRARHRSAAEIWEDLPSDNASGDGGAARSMPLGDTSHRPRREAPEPVNGGEVAPKTPRPDGPARTTPAAIDAPLGADGIRLPTSRADRAASARAPARMDLSAASPQRHHVVIPGGGKPAPRPDGNAGPAPAAFAARSSAKKGDASTTTEVARSSLSDLSQVLAALVPRARVVSRDGDTEAPVATPRMPHTESAAPDMQSASDAFSRHGPSDTSPRLASAPPQSRTMIPPARERLVTTPRISVAAPEPVDLPNAYSDAPSLRVSSRGPLAMPRLEPASLNQERPSTRIPAPPSRSQPTAAVQSRQQSESGHDTTAGPVAAPPQQSPVVIIRQAPETSAPTPAFWERRHLALWRLRLGR
jgi:hypothetical protein